MMEEQFRSLLTRSHPVALIVCPSSINFGEHPQGYGLPAIVLNVISDIEGLHMNGPDRFYEGRVQVDCYAENYRDAKTLSNAVRSLLHGYRDNNFRLIRSVSSGDNREGGTNEAERPYRVSMDFTTAWRA